MEHNCRYPQRRPFFAAIDGSTEGPGVPGTDWYGHPVVTYELWTVPTDEAGVVEYVSAGVMRGSTPYPLENVHDLGEIGFTTTDGKKCVHTIAFERSEPGAILYASQAICLYVPSNAVLFVALPLIGDQSGGAKVAASGYTLKL